MYKKGKKGKKKKKKDKKKNKKNNKCTKKNKDALQKKICSKSTIPVGRTDIHLHAIGPL